MKWLARLSATAVVIASSALGAECSAPPVRNSQQAVCYAMAYAAKNGLPRQKAAKTRVTKGKTVWTVRHSSTRKGERGGGWEVEVDAATGTVVRFTGYKGERKG
jgi:hypothetical protein